MYMHIQDIYNTQLTHKMKLMYHSKLTVSTGIQFMLLFSFISVLLHTINILK